MPAGVPVATMALDKAGARNAAIFAAEILALYDDALAKRVRQFKEKLERSVAERADRVKKELAKGKG
jgi:5-(carboxyamino)imidazole ribonucleotide mutase